MHITLSPVRMDATLAVTVAGETLTINGVVLDLSDIDETAAVENDWIAGPVTRKAGRLHLTLTLPHGGDAPDEARFPAPIIDPPDGPLALPGAAFKEAGAIETAFDPGA